MSRLFAHPPGKSLGCRAFWGRGYGECRKVGESLGYGVLIGQQVGRNILCEGLPAANMLCKWEKLQGISPRL